MATRASKTPAAKPAAKRGRARSNGRGSRTDLKRLAEQARTLTDREARKEVQATLASNIFDLRESGLSWMAISEELGWGDSNATGRMQWLYFQEDVRRNPELAIQGKTRAQLAAKIVKARGAGLSWGKIAAYADISEQFAKLLYEESSGEDAREAFIGKGGRRVGDGRGNLASNKPVSRTAAKPAKAKPATASKRGRKVADEDDEDETPAKPAAKRGKAAGPQRPKASSRAAKPAAGGARRPAARRR